MFALLTASTSKCNPVNQVTVGKKYNIVYYLSDLLYGPKLSSQAVKQINLGYICKCVPYCDELYVFYKIHLINSNVNAYLSTLI